MSLGGTLTLPTTEMPSRRGNLFRITWVALLILFMLNLAYAGFLAVSHDKASGDALSYYALAANLHEGQGFSRDYKSDLNIPETEPPFPNQGRFLYPYFVALVSPIFGMSIGTANLVAAFFKALLVIPIVLIAKYLFDDDAAGLAARPHIHGQSGLHRPGNYCHAGNDNRCLLLPGNTPAGLLLPGNPAQMAGLGRPLPVSVLPGPSGRLLLAHPGFRHHRAGASPLDRHALSADLSYPDAHSGQLDHLRPGRQRVSLPDTPYDPAGLGRLLSIGRIQLGDLSGPGRWTMGSPIHSHLQLPVVFEEHFCGRALA